MPPITVSTEVGRPAAEVFAYAIDPSHFHEWQKGVTVRRIGFADREVTSVITQMDPPRAWAVRGVDGPIRGVVGVGVEALDERRSRLTISVDFEGHGIGKVLVPLVVGPQARKELPGNLAALKARLEGGSG